MVTFSVILGLTNITLVCYYLVSTKELVVVLGRKWRGELRLGFEMEMRVFSGAWQKEADRGK